MLNEPSWPRGSRSISQLVSWPIRLLKTLLSEIVYISDLVIFIVKAKTLGRKWLSPLI